MTEEPRDFYDNGFGLSERGEPIAPSPKRGMCIECHEQGWLTPCVRCGIPVCSACLVGEVCVSCATKGSVERLTSGGSRP